MRVAYIHYLFDTMESSVGASVHVHELRQALESQGDPVDVIQSNPADPDASSLRRKIRSALKRNLRRYLAQFKALAVIPFTAIREWRAITRIRPDVMLVRYNLFCISSAVVAAVRRIPFVMEVNAPMAYESRTFNREILHLPVLPEFMEWLNLRLADHLIVVSEELGKYFRDRNFSPEKITVIPNGVDEHKFIPRPRSGPIRERYSIGNATVIGFIGSFHYWHGMENLLHLIQETVERFEDVVFLLVGPGPLKYDMEKHLRAEIEQNRVVFTGHLPHEAIPEILAAMDIVLAPYPKLDFFYYSPLKLFEYMSAGKAVVTSRIGQIADVVDDGVNGMVFEPDHPGEMEEKVFELIRSEPLRRRLGKNARQTVLEKHTWSGTAGRVREILASVIARAGRRSA